jgi:hypothetical protein
VRPFQLLAKCITDARVNACWYGVWQVAYAVYVFSAMFLPDNILDDILTELVRSIPGGREVLAFAMKRCMETDEHHALVSITEEAGAVVQQEFRDLVRKAKKEKKKKVESNEKKKSVYCGPPTVNRPGGWPKGWRQETFCRMSGASKGSKDHYYYSPQLNVKLRSIPEVARFLTLLLDHNGDESLVVETRHKKDYR